MPTFWPLHPSLTLFYQHILGRCNARHVKEPLYSLVGEAYMQVDCSAGTRSCENSAEGKTSSAWNIREGFLEVQAWQFLLGQGGWSVSLHKDAAAGGGAAVAAF